ncbi:hypothetical protein EHYA_01920 [Embleya hyalina]|jgi:hypothetical protein|uniref:Uncharacterized protein n=1 Tax=Embleya hyalina TaxID=516124 RepID=A0A401YI34_9ACTN|nr:hypothetical protein EHYA_01920 [Embleya hyalina]
MHIFFIALLAVVGVLVAWFAALTVSKLYKGQN